MHRKLSPGLAGGPTTPAATSLSSFLQRLHANSYAGAIDLLSWRFTAPSLGNGPPW